MDYQQKYLKYKSKYLEKKYGRKFRLRYKIDNNNDLYYKQKYFKYKSKYLDLKYGGAPTFSSLFGRNEEAYVQIEKKASLKEKKDFIKGQKETAALLKIKEQEQKENAKAEQEKEKIEKIRSENREKLLKKLEEILNNIPYDKKLVNCQVNFGKCEPCDEKVEKKKCKNGVYKTCTIIDNNNNLELKNTWFGKEIYCPKQYKYTSSIMSIINNEIIKSVHNTNFDSNEFSEKFIRILLKPPIYDAPSKFINSDKRKELIEYIIKKLKNYMGKIYLI